MVQRALVDGMVSAILGHVALEQWLASASTIRRHVFDTPRRRLRQADVAARRSIYEAAALLS